MEVTPRSWVPARARWLVAIGCLAAAAAPGRTQSNSPTEIGVEGTHFVDGSGRIYTPRWVSGLTLLSRTPAQQEAYLDWAVKTGFNGVRVFAGALTWARQTPEGARKGLPDLLERAAARGLAVEVTALTDTRTGYNAKAHLQAIVDIVAGRRGVLLELANEVGNPTQADDLTPERLRAWGREIVAPRGIVWAVGAANTDAPVQGSYPTYGGSYITVHLDRGGGMWPQVVRLRSLATIANLHKVPVINNEPMGADEQDGRDTGRQRWNDPAGFFALGALDRAFGLGGIHHSEAGLMAERPGPIQQQCADAYVAGHRTVESVAERGPLRHVEPGQSRSPVQSVTGMPSPQVLPFVAGDRAVVVLIGAPPGATVRWSSAWRQVSVVKSMKGKDGTRVDVIHAKSQIP